MVISGTAGPLQEEVTEIQVKVRLPKILARKAPDLMVKFAGAK
ncbi:MAG: hypothetical protein JWO13_8 [Acidobacteriales bacterium]|nr:hypothetical protein [Terriglobales bacterium]